MIIEERKKLVRPISGVSIKKHTHTQEAIKRRRNCAQEYIKNGIYREFSIVRKLCMFCYFIQINKEEIDMNRM